MLELCRALPRAIASGRRLKSSLHFNSFSCYAAITEYAHAADGVGRGPRSTLARGLQRQLVCNDWPKPPGGAGSNN